MNFGPPQWVKEAADAALNTVPANHYSHPKGRIRLREAIRDHYSKDFDRVLDVENEILVSSGANEGKVHLYKYRWHIITNYQDNMLYGSRILNQGTKSSFSNLTLTSICLP